MFRRIRNFLTRPASRLSVVVLLLSAAWAGWWFAPRWPLKSFTIDAAIGARRSPRNAIAGNIVCEYRGPRNNSRVSRGWAIMRLENGEILAKQDTGVGAWAQSLTGEFLVSADTTGWHVFDVNTARAVAYTDPNEAAPLPTTPIKFSADGRRFAVESNGILIFESSTARLIRHFADHVGPFEIDAKGGRLIAKPRQAHSLEIINVETGQAIVRMSEIECENVTGLKLSPLENYVAICADNDASADAKDSVHVWSINQQRRVATFPIGTFETLTKSIWFSANDRYLVVRERSSFVFDLAAQPPANFTPWLAGPTRQFEHADDGSVFIVSSPTHWSVYESGNELPLFQRRKTAMSWPGLSPDGQTVYMVDRNMPTQSKGIIAWIQKLLGQKTLESFSVQFIDVETGRELMTLYDHFPFHFDRPNNVVWTARIVNGAAASIFKTVLEKWELRRDRVPWWLWLFSLAGVGSLAFIRDDQWSWRRRRQKPKPLIVSAIT